MHGRTEYDHIDSELSKTYFGKGPHQKTGQTVHVSHVNKRRRTRQLVLFFLLFLISLGSLGYLNRHHITQIFAGTNDPPPGHAVNNSENETAFYDFETDPEGWEIPFWAAGKPDHVALDFSQTTRTASHGTGSLQMDVKFPGGRWTAAYIEITHYLDLGNYDKLSADIYVPPDCPRGLKARFILTVGEDWRFVEMSRSYPLTPGRWFTLSADLTENSYDWKKTVVDLDFKSDIRKLGIRIESNHKPLYSGPVYIDNVRARKTGDL